MAPTQMKVTYQSPSTSDTFARSLPSLPSNAAHDGVQSKTSYLASLRTAIGEIQGDVNTYLTRLMDLENASQPDTAKESKTKDEVEEERYGEEDADADS